MRHGGERGARGKGTEGGRENEPEREKNMAPFLKDLIDSEGDGHANT